MRKMIRHSVPLFGVVMACVLMVSPSLDGGEPPESVRPPVSAAVAVLDFTDVFTHDASLGMALADLVEAGLSQRGCGLVERRRIRMLLGERSLVFNGIADPASLNL